MCRISGRKHLAKIVTWKNVKNVTENCLNLQSPVFTTDLQAFSQNLPVVILDFVLSVSTAVRMKQIGSHKKEFHEV